VAARCCPLASAVTLPYLTSWSVAARYCLLASDAISISWLVAVLYCLLTSATVLSCPNSWSVAALHAHMLSNWWWLVKRQWHLTTGSWVDHSARSVFNEFLQSVDSISISVRAQVFQFSIGLLWRAGGRASEQTHSDFARYEVSMAMSTHAHSSCALRHVKSRTLRRDKPLTPPDQKVSPLDKETQIQTLSPVSTSNLISASLNPNFVCSFNVWPKCLQINSLTKKPSK
jgi:hypothetical protein